MPERIKRASLGILCSVPIAAFLLAGLVAFHEARADRVVTSVFAAKATTGASSKITFTGGQTQDAFAFQVKWTGTAVVAVKASLDGSTWDTIATYSGSGGTDLASGKIFVAPILGAVIYELDATTCTSCSIDANVTASGNAQVVKY